MSAFGSGHDLRVLGSSLVLGFLLSRESSSPSAPPQPHSAFALSQIKILKSLFLKDLIYLFERERKHKQAEGQSERKKQAPH